MKPGKRRHFTQADKTFMWDRWQKGESLNSIARLLSTSHSAIAGVLSKTGGVRPADRQRSRIALTLADREEISRGVAAGYSLRTIAKRLGRAPSTISREVKRNGGRQPYRANKAEQAAWDRAHRAKTCKLAKAALPIHTSLMSAIGGKADITIEFKARVVLSLDAKLQNYSLWIWAILVIAGRAIKHHKNKKNNNANNWDQRNEQPPTCAVRVVKSAYPYPNTWQ